MSSENNGTDVVNRLPQNSDEGHGENGTAKVKKGRKSRKDAGSKTKASRFWTLWNATRENSSGKARLKGHVNTDLGEVVVTLNSFPAEVTDDSYIDEARASSIGVKYDLEGFKAAGVALDSATDKLKGEAAVKFLESVQDTDTGEDESDDE